jgi:hypothetical protein
MDFNDNDDIEIDWNDFKPIIIPSNTKETFYKTTSEIDNILDVKIYSDEEIEDLIPPMSIVELNVGHKQFSVTQPLLQNEKNFHHNTNLIFTFPIDDIPDFHFFFLNNGQCS